MSTVKRRLGCSELGWRVSLNFNDMLRNELASGSSRASQRRVYTIKWLLQVQLIGQRVGVVTLYGSTLEFTRESEDTWRIAGLKRDVMGMFETVGDASAISPECIVKSSPFELKPNDKAIAIRFKLVPKGT